MLSPPAPQGVGEVMGMFQRWKSRNFVPRGVGSDCSRLGKAYLSAPCHDLGSSKMLLRERIKHMSSYYPFFASFPWSHMGTDVFSGLKLS